MRTAIRCSVHGDGRATVVELLDNNFGSIDSEKVAAVREQLVQVIDQVPTPFLVLDVAAVTYAGAAFLGLLASLVKRVRRLEKTLIVCGDRKGLVTLAGLDRLFPTLLTVEDALRHCTPH